MKNSKDKTVGFLLAKKYFIRIITGITLLISGNANAQRSCDMALRSGVNFPVKNLGNTKLEMGLSFEATLAYKFTQNMAAYAGWGLNAFDEKREDDDLRMHFEETGYTFGLHYKHAFAPGSNYKYMLGAGGTYNHIETENTHGHIINDSGHGIGWQMEAGLGIQISDRAQLIPSVRYRELSRVMTTEGITATGDLNYFSAGLIVTWTMWSKN